MSTRTPHATVAEASPDEVLSIDQIMERYPGEWILMRVTAHDADGWPTHGCVTVHAPTQNDMLDEMERGPTAPQHARLRLHSFLADRSIYIDDPAEIRQFIAEWIEADE
ncbi:MAG: hypothetical protein QOJ59_5329 [Thermomicrobiales bacterium]|jgi:hypothetical protein|nr:hypothetical protein [Thermomicrobiales bacterium]